MLATSSLISLTLLSTTVSASLYSPPAKHAHHHGHVQRASTLPSGWSSLGCKGEPSGGRILSNPIGSYPSTNTAAYCIAQCAAQNYQYAGTEYGYECWCGNALNQPSTLPDSSCNTPCAGDSSEKCGGGYIMNLYGKTSSPTVTWTDKGCYQDQSARTLAGPSLVSSSMTRSMCQNFCSGYTYAGVENGSECYCGNALTNNSPIASGNCNSKCAGNQAEICGGGNWQLTLFQSGSSTTTTTTTTTTTSSTSTASGTAWSSFGCYIDSNTRTLSATSTSSSSMTQEVCQTFCSAYTYAGVENGNECWCSNTINTSLATSAGECSTNCAGNSSQKCGGGWRLSVFKKGAASTTTATTTTSSATATSGWINKGCYGDQSARTLNGPSKSDSGMTPAMCQTFCTGYTYAGTENRYECYCGNTLTVNNPVSADNCQATCQGDPSQICGGTNWKLTLYQYVSGGSSSTTSATTTTSSAAPTSTLWTNKGCYGDQSARTLNGISQTSSSMTPTMCQNYCAAYAYAGVENGQECYCGNYLTANNPAQSSECASPCAGNPSQICGGGNWKLTLYQSTINPPLTLTYQYIGCYTDSNNRVLPVAAPTPQGASGYTPQTCQVYCSGLGYAYAGLEAGAECRCGNKIIMSSDSGVLANPNECQQSCNADSSQKCGGNWRLGIYYNQAFDTGAC